MGQTIPKHINIISMREIWKKTQIKNHFQTWCFLYLNNKTRYRNWTCTVYEDHVCKTSSSFKEACLSFVKHFIVWMQMFLFFPPLFCWNLAPHPLPSACQGDSGEWIYSKGSQQSLLLNWTFHELGPTAGSMHQKISNFSSLLWPVFHTDYYYQHTQHPHVSICQSDICLSAISGSQRFIWGKTQTKMGILSCRIKILPRGP